MTQTNQCWRCLICSAKTWRTGKCGYRPTIVATRAAIQQIKALEGKASILAAGVIDAVREVAEDCCDNAYVVQQLEHLETTMTRVVGGLMAVRHDLTAQLAKLDAQQESAQ
jgi:hypothetical protein